jgi:hypothetical protein
MANTKGRPKKESGVYTVSLSLNDKLYTHTGINVLEAVDKFANTKVSLLSKGIIFKTKSYLSVEKGGEKQTEFLTGWQVRRFFVNPTARKLVIKRFNI